MNKIIKMAAIAVGAAAMLGFAGCGNESSNGAGDGKATSKPTVKMTPVQEFASCVREVNELLKEVTGESFLSELGDEAEVSKIPADEFKAGYDKLMPAFKNAKVYYPLAKKAKVLAEELESKYKVPTGRIRQLGYNQRDVKKFLELDDVPTQLKAIEDMKATIVELEKYKKQLASLMK